MEFIVSVSQEILRSKCQNRYHSNLSQTFKDIIPFGLAIIIIWVFDLLFRNFVGINFAEGVITFFQPIFQAADGYIGLAIIYGAMSLFWFVGVHGPSIVEPAISAALVLNLTTNLEAYQAGHHATKILTLEHSILR